MKPYLPGYGIYESTSEEALMVWFGDLGYQTLNGGKIAPGMPRAERDSYREVLLLDRLQSALDQINPGISAAAREEAIRKLRRTESPSPILNNRQFHQMLVDGVDIEEKREGQIRGDNIKIIDFENFANNDWLAVNQFTVEDRRTKRPDVVVFVNGIPLGMIELKNPADEDADIDDAFNQIQTYKQEVPSVFVFNELCVIDDGSTTLIGSLTSPREWFHTWRTIQGEELASESESSLEVLTKGVFEKERLLDFIRHFIAFVTEDNGQISKKIAGYHQYHATRRAVAETLRASLPAGDRRAGVVWHTQGSGKSLTMAFYAGKLALTPGMANPTIVVLTDRLDLDDQLFNEFVSVGPMLREDPVRAKDRSDLRQRLQVASGGLVFTTIQKFFPEEKGDRYPLLSDRRNIVVIADEAHRSQYGFIQGFARHMRDALPNATFVAFTGTPIELADRDTRAVFGDYIDVYDIRRAVEDKATVPIYYESRLAKLDLDEEERPNLDEEVEEVIGDEEENRQRRLKSKWSRLEAVVGSKKRLELIAHDILQHFDDREQAIQGKAMIVCMSRRICVDLYSEIIRLRPEWHSESDESGVMKVVMTGSSSDPAGWQPHIRNSDKRKALALRFKNAADPFKVVLVRDMWLTGFDVPSLHTMYVDKPMRGHTLMQGIARVNRVFGEKPGGLIVDYLGIAEDLKKALAAYSEGGGKGELVVNLNEAVAVMQEKLEVCQGMFHGFDYSAYVSGSAQDRIRLLPAAQQNVLAQEDGRDRYIKAVVELTKSFALAASREEAVAVRYEVAFFQAVKAQLVKYERGKATPEETLDQALRQIVSEAIAPEGVIDIFQAAGLQKPDVSMLSDAFLADVREMPHKNLAIELLQKLLNDEIKVRKPRNIVQSATFAERLEETIRKYNARAITTAQVIEQLIELAREMREAASRGEQLGLSDEELAFYDALETNDSAVKVLGDDTLRTIARELTQTVRRNVGIDWSVKETARANLRRLVRRILRKHGYPPDKSEKATQTVLQQAIQLGFDFAGEITGPTLQELEVPAPFEVVPDSEVRPYENGVPLLSLKAAAGQIGDSRAVEPEAWVKPNGRTKPGPGLFVAQVIGESMNRRIPNGSYCVFRYPVEGSRQGRVILVEHRDIADPDLEGPFTLKIWESDKEVVDGDSWRHAEIRLKPDTTATGYEPIIIRDVPENSLNVVAEFVETLPSSMSGIEHKEV